MWILSLLFSLAGSAANLFFSLRYPSVAITPIIALVLVHPLGRFWDALLKRIGDPTEVFENGTLHHREPLFSDIDCPDIPWSTKVRLWLAQGNWNEKEHACVYISSNVAFGFAFATDVSAHPYYLRPPCLTREIGDCRATQILPAGCADYISTATDHLNSSFGLCIRGSHSSVPGAAVSHDLAGNPDVDRHVLHDAQDCQQKGQRLEYFSLQVLHSCMGRGFPMVLRSGLVDARSQLLQCDYLARSQKCGGV